MCICAQLYVKERLRENSPLLQCNLYHFQRDPGPLRAATPDLNIWGANLSLTPERNKAGNKPLQNWSLEIVFSLFYCCFCHRSWAE